MIKRSIWSKEHVIEGIKRVCLNPEMKDKANQLDAYEFGVYRGESTQLIDNMFYGFQFPIKNIYGFDSFEGLPSEMAGVERFYLFTEGFFRDVGDRIYPLRPNGMYIKCWFNQLTSEHVGLYKMKPAAFVHIDGDLYISCVDSLKFLFENNLIVPGTVIAFDEFKSTSTLESGGESLAWKEATEKYKIESVEFFRNIYFDQLECWQNAIEIKSIGEKAQCNLLN